MGQLDTISIEDINSVIVMNYIGINDKNGNPIYEHDILSDGGVVEFFDNLNWDSGGSVHSGFYCKKWFEYKEDGALNYNNGFINVEVVGNIYDNTELLLK